MCIATGPVQTIWVVCRMKDGKEYWNQGFFSRKDWARDAAKHWQEIHPKYTYEVQERQLDWWMRCH